MKIRVIVRVGKNGHFGHWPGELVMDLPCVPRIGDRVCANATDDVEGIEVKEVYLTHGDPIPLCCGDDYCDNPDDAQEWWESFGYVFQDRGKRSSVSVPCPA